MKSMDGKTPFSGPRWNDYSDVRKDANGVEYQYVAEGGKVRLLDMQGHPVSLVNGAIAPMPAAA